MKKNAMALFVGIVLISSAAIAADDWTILGSVAPNATVNRDVSLPEGQMTIEVIPQKTSCKMSCRFGTYNKDSIVQENTNHCLVKNFNWSSVNIDVKISNLDSKTLDYKIWVHKD
jgi:hypothetical protein